MTITFHIYSLINVFLISFFGQELNFYLKGYKRKTRFVLLLIFSTISFVGVILFDIFELKSIPTLIYDIVLSGGLLSLMFLRKLDVYKVMQKAGKKKEVKKLNRVFYIISALIILLPFIAVGLYMGITKSEELYIPHEYLGYIMLAIFSYLALSFAVLLAFAQKYHKHYLKQLSEEKEKEKE